jgi:hypothetical protein
MVRHLSAHLAARPPLDRPVLVSGLIFAAKMLGFIAATLCGLIVFLLIAGKRVIRRLLHPRA